MRLAPPSLLDMMELQDWEQQPELASYLEESLRERQRKSNADDIEKNNNKTNSMLNNYLFIQLFPTAIFLCNMHQTVSAIPTHFLYPVLRTPVRLSPDPHTPA